MNDFYTKVGMVTVGLIIGTALTLCVGLVTVLFIRYCPRVYFGKPKTNVFLKTIRNYKIITNKAMERDLSLEDNLVIQNLRVTGWFGIGSRYSPDWFIGFLRLHEEENK